MPHSLVLNLLPRSPIPPGYLTGKHVHALFLSLVSSVDQALGDRLHVNSANKAFTLSPLQVQRSVRHSVGGPKPKTPDLKLQYQHRDPIPAATPCWWRVSLLDDGLFRNLSSLWLNLNPQHPWHLGPADLQITSVLGTPQSTQRWANFSNYEQLYEEASDQERKITFCFCTPTAFRQKSFDSALPTRELVFGSLLRRWNEYSSIQLNEGFMEYLFPSYFDIRTEITVDPRQQFAHTGAVTDPSSQFMGCVGKMTFRIMGHPEAEAIKTVNALADFALYAGVGRKTTMGMGIVRRV